MEAGKLDRSVRDPDGYIDLLIIEDRPMKYPSLTLYVVFSIAVLIIYTITEQVLSSLTGISHDTLTTCFYACFGGEILCCALIKIFKLKEGNNGNLYNCDNDIVLSDNSMCSGGEDG